MSEGANGNGLVFSLGADVSDIIKELKKLDDKLDITASSIQKIFYDENKVPFKVIIRQVETLENGMKRVQNAAYQLQKTTSGEFIGTRMKGSGTEITALQNALNKLIASYKKLSKTKQNDIDINNKYIASAKAIAKLAAQNGETRTKVNALDFAQRTSDNTANRSVQNLIALENQRHKILLNVERSNREITAEEQQQVNKLNEQITRYQNQLSMIGRERVGQEALFRLSSQRLRNESELNGIRARNRLLAEQERASLEMQTNLQRKLNQMEIANAEAKQKNLLAANQLRAVLDTETKRYINNGTVSGKLMNSVLYGASAIMQGEIYSALSSGTKAIKEYEVGLVNLRRTIQGVTEKDLSDLGTTAIKYAQDFGQELSQVQSSMTELARAGVDDVKTLKDLSKTVAIGLNTTEIETAADMVGYLISTIKQLDMSMDDSMDIIDSWNYLADQYAVHTDDFAKAIQRAGSASKNLGLDLHDLNAMVTILGEATQASGENIGTAIRALEVRLLRPETIATLEGYGIAVKKSATEFLSFKEIMNNVNEVIKDLDDNSIKLSKIMDAMGGSWRKNWITTLTNDWERFDELVQEQANNMCYSIAENEKAMDTLDKKLMQLKQAWIEAFVIGANESGATENIKNMVEFTSELIESLTDTHVVKFIGDMIQLAAIFGTIKLTLMGINKLFATEIPTSANALLRTFELHGNKFFSNKGLFSKESFSHNFMNQISSMKDANNQLVYSLEEQLSMAQRLDKQYGTNNASIVQQRMRINDLELTQAQYAATLTDLRRAEVAGNNVRGQRIETEHRLERINQELASQNRVLNDQINRQNTNDERSIALRRQLTIQNLKLVASQLALNVAMGLATSLIIVGIFTLFDKYVNYEKNLTNAAKQAKDALAEIEQQAQNDIQTIEELSDRFHQLSLGVNSDGENVSLSNDEYKEYLDIIKQIESISPEITERLKEKGITIKNNADALNEYVKLLREQQQLELRKKLDETAKDTINASAYNTRKVISEELAEAVKDGSISPETFDYAMTGPKYRIKVYEEYAALNGGASDAYKEAIGESQQVLNNYAKTAEGYYELTEAQQKFISNMSKQFDFTEIENNLEQLKYEFIDLTDEINSNDRAKQLIEPLIDIDLSNVALNDYISFVESKKSDLEEALNFDESSSFSDIDLGDALGISDTLEQAKNLEDELSNLLKLDKSSDIMQGLISNNSVQSLMDLSTVLKKFDISSIEELRSLTTNILEENGKLNDSYLKIIKTLDDSRDSLAIFEGLYDTLKPTLDLLDDSIQDMALNDLGDIVNIIEDLDFSNLDKTLTDMESKFKSMNDVLKQYAENMIEAGNAVNEWTEKKSQIAEMDKTSKEYYDTMLEIGMQYPELIVGADNETGALILKAGAIDEIIDRNKLEIQQQADKLKQYAQIVNAMAPTVKSAIYAGIAVKEFFTDAVSNISGFVSGIASTTPYLSGMLETVGNALKNSFNGLVAKGKKIVENDTSGKYQEFINRIDEQVALINEQAKGYEILAANYKPYSGNNYGSTKKTTKNKKDEYSTEADKYHKYTQALSDIDYLLEKNEQKERYIADDIEAQIKLIEERNKLIQQSSDVTGQLMEAKKQELNDMVWALNELGYGIEWNRDANTLLIGNYDKLNKVTGDAAKEQEAMLKSVIELNEEIKKYSLTIDDNTASIYENNYALQKAEWEKYVSDQKKTYEESLNNLEKYKDGLNTLIELTIKMLKKEKEAEKEHLNELLKGYKSIIDAKKAALDKKAENEDYEKELQAKQKTVTDLQNKLAELTNDNSLDGRAQKLQLQEELLAAQDELNTYQRDRDIELQKEALDKEYEQYEDSINERLDAIDKYLNEEGKLRQEAMKLIASQSESFYKKLLEYNRMYGDGIDATVTEAWEYASQAIDKFGISQSNVLDLLGEIAAEMERIKNLSDELSNMPPPAYEDPKKDQTTESEQPDRAKEQLNQQRYLHDQMVLAIKTGDTGLIHWIKENRKEWGNKWICPPHQEIGVEKQCA